MAGPYPVREAKAKFDEILRRVKQGQSVTISERGKAIARVVPLDRPPGLASGLAQLEQNGVILRRGVHPGAIRPLVRRRGALGRFLRSRG